MSTTFGVPDERIKRVAAVAVVGSGGLVGLGLGGAGSGWLLVAGLLIGFVLGGGPLVLTVLSTTGRRVVAAVRGGSVGPRHRPADLLEVLLVATAVGSLIALPLTAARPADAFDILGVSLAGFVGTALVVLARAGVERAGQGAGG